MTSRDPAARADHAASTEPSPPEPTQEELSAASAGVASCPRSGGYWLRKKGPTQEFQQEIERLSLLRLRHLQMLTGADSCCVLFGHLGKVEPLFWLDTPEGDRAALVSSICDRRPAPQEWELLSQVEGDFAIFLCLKGGVRHELKAVKSYLIHWFAAQKFPCRGD